MVFDRKKRFIAGAVCPHCKQQDTVMVFNENGVDKRGCVACHVEETLTETPPEFSTPPEPVKIFTRN
jgi:uncharacterized metal-binding protein (TIGR02443 family)